MNDSLEDDTNEIVDSSKQSFQLLKSYSIEKWMMLLKIILKKLRILPKLFSTFKIPFGWKVNDSLGDDTKEFVDWFFQTIISTFKIPFGWKVNDSK